MDGRGAHGNGANHFEVNENGNRLKVLHEVQQRHLTQVAASRAAESNRPPGGAGCCSASREQGDAALVHGLREAGHRIASWQARFEEKVFDSRGSALCRLRGPRLGRPNT